MKKSVLVCDVCEDVARETSHYEIKAGDSKAGFDLCEEHAGPLDALLRTRPSAGPPSAAKVASDGASKPKRGRVMTLEEIEAGKRDGHL